MDDTITFLTASGNLPFIISGSLMLAIMIMEFFGLLIGMSLFSHDVDMSADLDGNGIPDYLEGGHGGAIDWLNPGHVPLMAFVVIYATFFTVIGFGLQSVFAGLTGHLAPLLLSIPVVIAITLPFSRWGSLMLARVMPRDLTTAVSVESLVGLSGVVNVGPVSRETSGMARFTDNHGTDHNLFVFNTEDTNIDVGENVVLLGPHREKSYAHLVRKI